MNVVVTGGAGYIGSHTCKELAKQGHNVTVFDNLSTGHRSFVKWGDFFYGDIRDMQALRKCLKTYRPDGIIHFAASAYVGESVINPGKYYSNNVNGTLCLLECMREEQVFNIVVSSSCAVYGQPEVLPIEESSPLKPINPYGATKLFMERMLSDFLIAYDMRYMALRYFNAAGCDVDCEVGELHEPETHLIPRILQAALGKIPYLEVFGSDFPTPDGTCIRDYVHVSDLASAHVTALEQLIKKGESICINLGTGRGYSIKEIIRQTERIVERSVPNIIRPRRKGDPAELVANPISAQHLLSWTPQNSCLENIIATALNFMIKK